MRNTIKNTKKIKKKKTSLLAYLAGAMEYAYNEGINWRRIYQKILAKECNISAIIPNDEEKKIKKDYNFNYLKENNLDKYIEIMRQFIDADLQFVESVDMLIVRWEGERTAGTVHEVGHAYQIGTPCYLVTSKKPIEVPGWFLACFTKYFPSLKALVQYLKQQYK